MHKGDHVLVAGRLSVRTWEGDDGTKRTSTDISADEVGASLRWATGKMVKVSRKEQGSMQNTGPSKSSDFDDAPPF